MMIAPDITVSKDSINSNDVRSTAIDASNISVTSVHTPGKDAIIPTVPSNPFFELSSLNGNNGFIINGIATSDYSGISVDGAGDVNGDGIDDLIINALRSTSSSELFEQSYVFFGKATGFQPTLNLSTLNGFNGFTIRGTVANDTSQITASSAGDVNGDGVADLIVSELRSGNSSVADKNYVVFGKSTGLPATVNLSALNGSNGFVITEGLGGDVVGTSVSGAGDVNGDGIDDLVIGASEADPNGKADAGQSYVVFGKTTGFLPTLDLRTLDGINGFTLIGHQTDDYSGFAISGAGDVNGDDIDDLIISAPEADPNGIQDSGQSFHK